MKNKKIALLGLSATGSKIITGPVTMLILASTLTTEEIGFYYVFFSLIASSQLLEFGIGWILKHFYAYEKKENNKITNESIRNISSLYAFSLTWYSFLAIGFLALGIILGEINFNSYVGDIKWRLPWYLVLISASLNLIIMPLKAYLDGLQFQVYLYTISLICQVSMAISLWLSLYNNLGLYSIAISQLTEFILFLLLFNLRKDHKIKHDFSGYSFKSKLKQLSPLLKKTGIVCFLVYFYWNGFNFISFNVLSPTIAGIIGLSIALGRAGMGIAASITQSQSTIYSNLISRKELPIAISSFKKFRLISNLVLISGYTIFIISILQFPNFFFFEKILEINNLITLFLFFYIAHNVSVIDNFTRCFKVELFVKIQFINSVLTPLSFFITTYMNINYFSLPCVVIIFIYILTKIKFNHLIKQYKL
ncbi:O81 family O-antigen flippase [Providencia rettgeri]|uniref:O81 family O-antigen flippase n=1 Tax=Providencia rettgeri TaxID=587 RepID=UPI002220578C|nr:O81 family O-antigen flippase [Providencia rettgeri]ELR5279292.1 O81 family O-antigen flippase [Providencia rettgeri]ELU1436638.1 O81 family O-antigen flippase [Providencia rettgeri]UYV41601.1 O81 family O-antigen flippase [Providencia rettgeri]